MKVQIVLVSLIGLISLACATNQTVSETKKASPKSEENQNANMANVATEMAHDHSSMQSSPDADKAPYDLQFLDTMIAHHQGAIDMAKPAAEKSQNEEFKKFAANIISAQEKEIVQMKTWRDDWYGAKPPAINMNFVGMMNSMMGMDMKKLTAASGKDFDSLFVQMMIPHHEGAVAMAKDALTKAEHVQIKKLAEGIIKAQEGEIKTMENWKTNWTR